MPRGLKTCSKCGSNTGPRAKTCSKCGQVFAFKLKEFRTVRGQAVHWRTLTYGDHFKVISGTGPYCIVQKDGEQERVPMGYAGIFKVSFIDPKGIGAYPIKANGESGLCFIYMGPDEDTDFLCRRAHKIEKLKKSIS